MQARWLKRNGGSEVIVVFGGWAVGADCLSHLAGPQDVLFVDDYRDPSLDLPDISAYARRRLLAWSFGVAAYGHWRDGRADPFTRKTAIAGTMSPVDDRLGIPTAVVDQTRAALTEDSFASFQRRCFGQRVAPVPLDIPARQDELAAVASRGAAPETQFDAIILPTRDRIFPPANMARAWAGQAGRIQQIDAPHAPFGQWQSWDDMP